MSDSPTRGERAVLVEYLEHYRATLELKYQGLDADAWEAWRREVAHAREVLDGLELDTVVDVHGEGAEVRDLIVHLIEEYARHCGHAVLLRECVDGRTGQ